MQASDVRPSALTQPGIPPFMGSNPPASESQGLKIPLIIRFLGACYLACGGWHVLKQFFSLLQEIGGAFVTGASVLWMEADASHVLPRMSGYQLTPAGLALLINLIIYGIMTVAGWKLLKTTRNAIRWASISAVLATMLNGLIIATVLVMMRDFYSAAVIFMSSEADVEKLISLFSSYPRLMQLILPMYFPPLALYLLNRRRPRQWLAQHGR
jgi:hypothetical protein